MCQEGRRKTRIFVHTICFGQTFFFGPKQCKAGNTIKIGVSAEIVKKSKNDTFFWKRVSFDMVEKVDFTNCVFEKLCFPENTIFIVFSAKHSFKNKNCMLTKNRKFMKNSGLFLNMAKWCFFWVCFLRF